MVQSYWQCTVTHRLRSRHTVQLCMQYLWQWLQRVSCNLQLLWPNVLKYKFHFCNIANKNVHWKCVIAGNIVRNAAPCIYTATLRATLEAIWVHTTKCRSRHTEIVPSLAMLRELVSMCNVVPCNCNLTNKECSACLQLISKVHVPEAPGTSLVEVGWSWAWTWHSVPVDLSVLQD